ncbi:MAG TPA: DUF1761 domain-containing protein [Candidatus Saccharimonadales bacterium]|nr:DUF1761 domain-containing protein [Candidatus Saccharimonadales bacterium]
MLELEGINFWAVTITWLVYTVVGAYWYSPVGFGKQWTKHTGIDIMKLPEKEATRALAAVAFSALLQVLALAIILNSLDVASIISALGVGVLLWLGLTTATTVGATLYQRRSWKFLWLNSSYFLLVMLIGSIILAIWR